MAKQEQLQMEMMLQIFRQTREDDRVREEQREKESENREQEREERHCQLLRQLKDSQPAAPQMVNITQTKLPLMKDTDDVEIFVKQLETVMRSADVPRTKSKHHLLTQLTVTAKEPLDSLLEDGDIQYEEVKEAIMSRKVMTNATAAEAYYSNNRELLYLPVMQTFTKLKRWLIKMEGAVTEDLRRDKYMMGHVRSQLTPELKMFIDLSKPQTAARFESLVEQWSISQPSKCAVFINKTTSTSRQSTYGLGSLSKGKKPLTCYHCGKAGHIAKECRQRVSETPKNNTSEQKEQKPIVCYNCKEVGHKSPQCPNNKRERVKKIKILASQVETLGENDVMASANSNLMPMTLNSGAEMPIVTREFVRESEYTGETFKFRGVLTNHEHSEAKVASVKITIGHESFQEQVVAVPGEDLGWMAVLRFRCGDPEQLYRVAKMMSWKHTLPAEDICTTKDTTGNHKRCSAGL